MIDKPKGYTDHALMLRYLVLSRLVSDGYDYRMLRDEFIAEIRSRIASGEHHYP